MTEQEIAQMHAYDELQASTALRISAIEFALATPGVQRDAVLLLAEKYLDFILSKAK